jgi:hypothetical protein
MFLKQTDLVAHAEIIDVEMMMVMIIIIVMGMLIINQQEMKGREKIVIEM